VPLLLKLIKQQSQIVSNKKIKKTMNAICYILFAIGAVFVLMLGIFSAVLAQTHIHNQPLKIRRKRLKIILSLFLIILFITLIAGGIAIYGTNLNKLICFWKGTFNRSFIGLILLFTGMFLYAYFKKDVITKK